MLTNNLSNVCRTKSAQEARQVLGILEESYSGQTRGAGGEASRGVFQGDAADGEHGNGDGAGNLGKALETLRRAVGVLRRRGKNRAEEDIVGAVGSG